MHAGAVSVGLPHKSLVTEEIRRGLVVQKHDLPEVSLLEKLRNSRSQFFIDLPELESVAHLKVGNFLISIRFGNVGSGLFQLCKLSVDRGECFLRVLEVLLEFTDATRCARDRFLVVFLV
jgi:hypothetical protein